LLLAGSPHAYRVASILVIVVDDFDIGADIHTATNRDFG
jgi:hypothetical protein